MLPTLSSYNILAEKMEKVQLSSNRRCKNLMQSNKTAIDQHHCLKVFVEGDLDVMHLVRKYELN